MTNSPYVRAALAQAALELAPPLMRDTLLDERSFRNEYGFRTDAVLAFGDSAISVQRSELFSGIRKIFNNKTSIELYDTEGKLWALKLQSKDSKVPTVVISSGDQRLILPDFSVLSPDGDTRLCSLDKAASDVNLPASAVEAWRNTLHDRALEDDEVDRFYRDLRLTPIYVARSIRAELEKGESRLSSLVPPYRRYYERLIGVYDGSTSIRDFAAGPGKEIFNNLLRWRSYDGFLMSLFLSSHSALTLEISVEDVGTEDLMRAFEHLLTKGDRISQLGAIEVGLRILFKNPDIEPPLIRLIEKIREDDVQDTTSQYRLLSALFILVDGELARTRILGDTPPFYRRLAALSQAALVHRQIASVTVDIESFCDWAVQNRGEYFYFQSLVDMRLEPRWNPDLAAAPQMKAEFYGRIIAAVKAYEKNIAGTKLYGLVLGDDAGSIISISEFPRPYLPGPLEGKETNLNVLPIELAEAVESQLNAEKVGPASFVALVNSAMIFHVDTDQAKLAAKALKLGSYRLRNIEDRSQLLAILNGLASVAATSRSKALADELRILVRRYRGDSEYSLSVDEALRSCLVAAASHHDQAAWIEFVGAWVTELAFEDFKNNEGDVLYSHVQCLCHVVPELWVSCGRADAALAAYRGR